MKKVPACLNRLISTIVLALLSFNSFANHLVGMDLFYTWVSGNTYKITLIAYGDCGSAATTGAFAALSTAAPEIQIFNGNTLINTINLTIQAPSAGVEITPVCPADISLTQCTNTSYTIPGIKKFVYTANYTVSGPSAYWRFLFMGQLTGTSAGRALSISNIITSPVTCIELVDTLNNTVTHNSSPLLTNVPTPFFCLDNNDNYNPGAVDPDGDSLIFFLVPAQNGCPPGGPVSYLGTYTATNPLTASSWIFDQHTGQISFFPTLTARAVVVYNIEEFHGGAFRGTSQREMTFLVQTCTNIPPTGSLSGATAGTIADPTHFQICQNTGPFSFQINPTETDTLNNITVSVTGLPTGSSFVTTGNGTPHPHCTLSWTSTGVAAGVYTFYVTYTDNNCPLSGTQTIAYTITIVTQPLISYSLIVSASCVHKAFINIIPTGGGSPWFVRVSSGIDTIQYFSGVTGAFTDSIAPGTYILTIYSAAAGGCKGSATITIPGPTPVTLAPSFTNPSYCGIYDGTIKLHNLVVGTSDTIKYSVGGVIQPPVVSIVAGDGSVTLTGLGAGVYTGITVTYGYCVSNIAGPVTLTNPPFTMRALTSTNPVFCGVCNGTITLYGLHPGQLDTITYTFGGIPQPSVIILIPADSQVHLTGLCAGVYSTFIAKTAGVCVSNMLGPVTLTVPPFTIRAITSTNPDYCGICNGTVTLYGLHPGGTDTIYYTKGGVPQPPVSFLIPIDSTVTITGLCAGTYSNFVAHAGSSCVSNSLGPVTLTVPPFTIRALSHVNPSYCGICDGSITIYGVHPGETDSILYTYNGVAQPPIVRLVPADSQIVITGLCSGVYANFIARTAGTCVSNTLGPVTLTVPPFTVRALSGTNPDYCGICNGTITIYGLHPGESDTISYNFGGVPQPSVVRFIGPDSMAVLTGLCAGVYSNFIARTGGVCVSNTLGPITLTVPPFTVRALSWTNPDYCGICNGTITIYGLHPGETDTISYTYNGVAATPIVALIPADSQVHLTGLCFGVYDNFIARTGGVCVSNTLGPANLTVPPFTMRAIGFTNPTKCGFCNGTIKLYGLHPGQTDTINYNFNGVPFPPFSIIIGPDSTVTMSGLCEGIYSNFVANTGGVCVSNVLGPVTLKAPPIIPGFTYKLYKGCGGDTVVITNTSWPASDLTYRWFFGDGDSSTDVNPVHVYHSPGVDSIKLYITNTKCFDSTVQPVILDNLINAGFTSVPDSFACMNTPVLFTNTSTGTLLTYKWIFGDGGTAASTDASHTFKHPGNYNVILAVSNYVPCFDTVKRLFTVDSSSAISMTASDSTNCGGTAIVFKGIFATSGLTGIKWGFGPEDTALNQNPISHVFSSAGDYIVFVEALYRACPDTSVSRLIHIFGQPSVNIGGDTAICPGSEPIQLLDKLNATSKNTRWYWNTGETTPGISIVEPGQYYVIVTQHGCSTTDSILVKNDCFMDIPNAFTPNGDGVNDYFFPRTLLSSGLTEFSMHIFNRWGQEIFATNTLDGRGWDGRLNNVQQPEGVYIYLIDAVFKDGQKEHHQGNVTLLR